MPIHKETYLIAQHRERFEPHIRVPIPQIEHIAQVHNKGTLAAYAMQQGLPTPQTWMPGNMEHFQSIASQVKLPAFVKLREAASGVGIRKVDTLKELMSTFEEFVEHFKLKEADYPIIQQGVPGNDYCVTTLFDHGKMVASMTYRGLRAFPAERGATVMRETVEAPEMERIAAELLGSLGWHGVAQLDFRWEGTPETTPYLIEVNPRFFGGLIQSVESGWDYPWLLFQLAVKGHIDPVEKIRTDVRTETPVLPDRRTHRNPGAGLPGDAPGNHRERGPHGGVARLVETGEGRIPHGLETPKRSATLSQHQGIFRRQSTSPKGQDAAGGPQGQHLRRALARRSAGGAGCPLSSGGLYAAREGESRTDHRRGRTGQ